MALTKSLSFSRGRKRILISGNSCNVAEYAADLNSCLPMKKRCGGEVDEELFVEESSLLEALPHDILVKVVCAVNHDDLKQLIHVSKTVRDATIIAEKSHFAYTTPSKTKVFRNPIDSLDFDMYETPPSAPKIDRRMNRLEISRKKLEDVSISLFANYDEEDESEWPRRSLFM